MTFATQTLFGHKPKSGLIRQIPVNSPGRLFVSPMPYGAYDPGNRLMRIYRVRGVECVLVLLTDSELARKAKRDLLAAYRKEGILYFRHPCADFQAPGRAELQRSVEDGVNMLECGKKVAIHCHAGVGRSAILACCLVRAMDHVDADTAIERVGNHMDINMTSEQERLVHQLDVPEHAAV